MRHLGRFVTISTATVFPLTQPAKVAGSHQEQDGSYHHPEKAEHQAGVQPRFRQVGLVGTILEIIKRVPIKILTLVSA